MGGREGGEGGGGRDRGRWCPVCSLPATTPTREVTPGPAPAKISRRAHKGFTCRRPILAPPNCGPHHSPTCMWGSRPRCQCVRGAAAAPGGRRRPGPHSRGSCRSPSGRRREATHSIWHRREPGACRRPAAPPPSLTFRVQCLDPLATPPTSAGHSPFPAARGLLPSLLSGPPSLFS